MKKIILLFTLGFTSLFFAQTTEYNKETLSLFNDENWDSLIELGEEAILKNHSSYEIEYRLAVAYYNSDRFFDSAKHFENLNKTYQINNDAIQEYLYYSYLFSGRNQDALIVSKGFPFHLQQKVEVKKIEFIDYLSTDAGIKLSSRNNIDIENMSYFNAGLGQKLGYHLSLNHAFTSLSQNYLDFNYKQKEYYLSANVNITKGLTLIPAYHYINITENTESTINRNNNPNNLISVTRANDEKIHLLHFALKKQWNRFFIMPNVSYSSSSLVTDNSQQVKLDYTQYGLDIGYTLSGLKDKLWLGFGANILNDDIRDNKFIWNAKAHYQINPKSLIYLKYLNANISNFSEDNAMYYYNSVSVLIDKFSATFAHNITPKLSWFINYQYENDKDLENAFSFTYNTIITGLKYDF